MPLAGTTLWSNSNSTSLGNCQWCNGLLIPLHPQNHHKKQIQTNADHNAAMGHAVHISPPLCDQLWTSTSLMAGSPVPCGDDMVVPFTKCSKLEGMCGSGWEQLWTTALEQQSGADTSKHDLLLLLWNRLIPFINNPASHLNKNISLCVCSFVCQS